MVTTSEQVPKDNVNKVSTLVPKKKKKTRQRNRIRNKCNRNKDNNIQIEAERVVDAIIAATLVEQQQLQQQQQLKTTAPTMKQATPNEPEQQHNAASVATAATVEKSREQINDEREAKKLAKQSKKAKPDNQTEAPTAVVENTKAKDAKVAEQQQSAFGAVEKTREQIKAEREAKKAAKQAAKGAKISAAAGNNSVEMATQQMSNLQVPNTDQTSAAKPTDHEQDKKKPTLTKAERRAIQESQRAAKAQAQQKKAAPTTKPTGTALKIVSKATPATIEKREITPTKNTTASPDRTVPSQATDCKVKLFNHLESARTDVSLFVNNPLLHPSISRLGEQYAKRTIVGSNARCIAFLNAIKMVVQDFETPPKKEFARSLETSLKYCTDHLHKCRPLAVSVSNAYKQIKHQLTQLPTDKTETYLKEILCHFIETYLENQIEKAAKAISRSLQEKIKDGDVLLTFGCSSLYNYIFKEAKERNVNFRVIIVDSRPYCEGQELLRRLTGYEIPCTYVLINALSFVMPEATKVILGAHALLSNGYVMSRTGTAQVALVARSFNVPVLVCCETHKFSERFQTDAIVYNELGNPDDLIISDKCCLTNWQAKSKMLPLNLNYDITPPELVTAVVTEVSILPCTSVPVILRFKPDIGY